MLSRRSAVRGAVWTVPAVTVAVAAPAYAAGVSDARPTINSATASYEGGASPDVINVNVHTTSIGPLSSLALQIPPRLFDSVASSTTATVTGSRDDGWTVLVPSPGADFYTALSVGSTTQSPWLGLRANDFVMTAVATSGTQTSDAFPVPVAYGGQSALEAPTVAAAWQSPTVLGVSAGNVYLDPDDQMAVGRLRVAVTLPAALDGETTTPSVVAGSHPGWELDATLAPQPRSIGGDWVFRFVTTQGAHTATTGVDGDRGPGTFGVALDVGGADLVVDGQHSVAFSFTSLETDFVGWDSEDSKVGGRTATALLAPPPA